MVSVVETARESVEEVFAAVIAAAEVHVWAQKPVWMVLLQSEEEQEQPLQSSQQELV